MAAHTTNVAQDGFHNGKGGLQETANAASMRPRRFPTASKTAQNSLQHDQSDH